MNHITELLRTNKELETRPQELGLGETNVTIPACLDVCSGAAHLIQFIFQVSLSQMGTES